MKHKSKIAYTVGEPAGIGPELILQLSRTQSLDDIAIIGDITLLKQRADMLGIELPDTLEFIDIPIINRDCCAKPDVANVDGVLNMLDHAIKGCLSGRFCAMVTGPLHKGIINSAGIAFSGHTEYLAEKTGGAHPVMLLATPTLRVALITTHLPLKDVSTAITPESITKVCSIVHSEMQTKYQIENPRILVCGLNPHAGEGGHLGMEEIDIIIPTLETLNAKGLNVLGPLPADTAFTPQYTEQSDVIIAMYHDQGLPVLKSQGFGSAANITLGLPIIRTSVDHGTAFDLAGSGRGDTGSLKTAIEVARQMVGANKRQ